MVKPNLYELLGVETSATQAEIKSAFRQQALRNHPDQGGNAALFHMVEDAYETLVSPSRRAIYDRQNRIDPTPSAYASTPDAQDEPTISQAAYSTQSHKAYEEPASRQWTEADWNETRWPGDEAFTWSDREPVDAKPTYIRKPDPVQFPAIRLPWYSLRIALLVAAIWMIVAVIFDWPAVPFVDNWTVVKMAIIGAVVWFIGPIVMRIGAWLLVAYTLWLAHDDEIGMAATVTALLLAFGLWFLGHWLHTFKTGEPKSFVATRLFDPLPDPIHPQSRFSGRID